MPVAKFSTLEEVEEKGIGLTVVVALRGKITGIDRKSYTAKVSTEEGTFSLVSLEQVNIVSPYEDGGTYVAADSKVYVYKADGELDGTWALAGAGLAPVPFSVPVRPMKKVTFSGDASLTA